MIYFRTAKKNVISVGTFITLSNMDESDYAKCFGFVTDITDKKATIKWLHFAKELGKKPVPNQELKKLKLILPSYRYETRQGELDRGSYLILVDYVTTAIENSTLIITSENAIDTTIWSGFAVDYTLHKNRALKGDTVKVTDAQIYHEFKLSTLEGTVIDAYQTEKGYRFDILMDGAAEVKLYNVHRSSFKLVRQDTYSLVSIKCSCCGRV